MTPQESQRWRRFNNELPTEIRIGCVLTDHPQSRQFKRFCDLLPTLADKILVQVEVDDTSSLPCLLLGSNLHYHALPQGKELEPFLAMLQALAAPADPAPLPAELAALATLDMPAELKLFIAVHCPSCPAAVRILGQLCRASRQVHATIIDAELFAQEASEHHIRAVPTIMLGQDFRWTGAVSAQELAKAMASRDPMKLEPAALERLIQEGRADRLAAMMLSHRQIFPAFMALLVHSALPIRLGAMVAVETLVENDRPLAHRLIGPLWQAFQSASDTVKGDILYIIGIIGDTGQSQAVAAVMEGNFAPEVREAAAEALEQLKLARAR